jgi:hypothetical protein
MRRHSGTIQFLIKQTGVDLSNAALCRTTNSAPTKSSHLLAQVAWKRFTKPATRGLAARCRNENLE